MVKYWREKASFRVVCLACDGGRGGGEFAVKFELERILDT